MVKCRFFPVDCQACLSWPEDETKRGSVNQSKKIARRHSQHVPKTTDFANCYAFAWKRTHTCSTREHSHTRPGHTHTKLPRPKWKTKSHKHCNIVDMHALCRFISIRACDIGRATRPITNKCSSAFRPKCPNAARRAVHDKNATNVISRDHDTLFPTLARPAKEWLASAFRALVPAVRMCKMQKMLMLRIILIWSHINFAR